MSNEAIIVQGSVQTLEANGGSIASAAIAYADDANLNLASGVTGGHYPNCKFVMSVTFSVAPTENTVLALYAEYQDIDGTTDQSAVEASAWNPHFLCAFPLNNVTSAQNIVAYAYDIPHPLIKVAVKNEATGQTAGAGWTLKATPFAYKPQ